MEKEQIGEWMFQNVLQFNKNKTIYFLDLKKEIKDSAQTTKQDREL